MSMPEESDDAAAVRRADRERRKREDLLLILLLLLFGKVQRAVAVVAIHGLPFASVIRSMVAGSAATGHAGAAPLFARTMAQAHRDGFRRAGLMAGVRTVDRKEAGRLADLADAYRPAGQRAADAMADTLTQAVQVALAAAFADGLNGTALRGVVREAFTATGYDRSNPYAVDLGAERAVVGAYNTGIIHAASSGALGEGVGLRHISVIDARTTRICQQRNGIQLPVADPYWQRNIPPLHEHCRSLLLVLTGDFIVNPKHPTEPPKEGFGEAPAEFLQLVGANPAQFGTQPFRP